MFSSVIISLTLTQPTNSGKKSSGHSHKGTELDKEKEKDVPNGNLDRLRIELEDAAVV